MFISYFVYPKHQVLLICNENKEILLPIWWYNRGSFPLWNKYFGVFVLSGLKTDIHDKWVCGMETNRSSPIPDFISIHYIAGASEGSEQTTHWRGKLLFVHNGLLLQCFVSSEPSDAPAILLNADWAGPTGKRTIWKFERSPRTMPWTPSRVRLPAEPALVTFSKMVSAKELGESALEC